MNIIYLLLLISFSSYAEENCNTIPTITPKSFTEIISDLAKTQHPNLVKTLLKKWKDVNRSYQMRKTPLILGRLRVNDSSVKIIQTTAQMQILECGFFLSPIADRSKMLSFLLQGMNPIRVNPIDYPLKDSIYFLGELKFEPLSEENKAFFKGKIQASTPQSEITITFHLKEEVNTPGGTDPRESNEWPSSYYVSMQGNKEFKTVPLTPAEYFITVSSNGHADVSFSMPVEPGNTKDLGTIVLEKVKTAHLKYVSYRKFPLDPSPTFDNMITFNQRWRANGISNKRKIGGFEPFFEEAHTFHFSQIEGKLFATGHYGNNNFVELGTAGIDAYRKVPLANLNLEFSGQKELRNGFSYLMYNDYFHYWILFEVHYQEQ